MAKRVCLCMIIMQVVVMCMMIMQSVVDLINNDMPSAPHGVHHFLGEANLFPNAGFGMLVAPQLQSVNCLHMGLEFHFL